jgi:hypothetical protein
MISLRVKLAAKMHELIYTPGHIESCRSKRERRNRAGERRREEKTNASRRAHIGRKKAKQERAQRPASVLLPVYCRAAYVDAHAFAMYTSVAKTNDSHSLRECQHGELMK